MRPRKFLLITRALTTAGLVAACKKETVPPPPPGNPKGSTAYEMDAGPPTITPAPELNPKVIPPSNSKGSHYDHALPAPSSVGSAGKPPR